MTTYTVTPDVARLRQQQAAEVQAFARTWCGEEIMLAEAEDRIPLSWRIAP